MDRIIEPTRIKPNEILFYFEENINFKGITKSFNITKTYMKTKVYVMEFIVHIMLYLV